MIFTFMRKATSGNSAQSFVCSKLFQGHCAPPSREQPPEPLPPQPHSAPRHPAATPWNRVCEHLRSAWFMACTHWQCVLRCQKSLISEMILWVWECLKNLPCKGMVTASSLQLSSPQKVRGTLYSWTARVLHVHSIFGRNYTSFPKCSYKSILC